MIGASDVYYERTINTGLSLGDVVAVSAITGAVIVTLLVVVRPAADAIGYAADSVFDAAEHVRDWMRDRWRSWRDRHGSTTIEDATDDHKEWCERLPDHASPCGRSRYLLVPGNVKSKINDGDLWISAFRLLKLYGVRQTDCVVWREHDGDPARMADHYGLIVLQPQTDGDYTIPSHVALGCAHPERDCCRVICNCPHDDDGISEPERERVSGEG